MRRPRHHRATSARGASAVEMALVLLIFVNLMLAAADLARWTMATASLHEAAREGARVAVVCDPQDPQILERAVARMVALHTQAQAPTVTVQYEPSGCGVTTCSRVRVALSGARLQGMAPFWPGGMPLPAAMVELPRESLSSNLLGRSNPRCL